VHTLQVGQAWFPEESGGLNRYYTDLVRHLPGVGVDVTGLVTGSDQVADISHGAVHAFSEGNASLPARLRRVRAHTRTALVEQPDGLVVAHFALYAAPSLDLIRRRPLVMHFHGPWAEESRVEGAGALAVRAKRYLEMAVYRRAVRFIVLSRAFAVLLEESYGVEPERIRVIPGGVEVDRFAAPVTRDEARECLGWPDDRPIVLVVRRLVRRMGLEDLIASVRHARAKVPDLLVLIAGSGPLAAELEARRDEEDVADATRLLGFVPDDLLPLAYRAADLSLVPSLALEGFGLIVAESLAAGTPVVVTDVGGLPEAVEGLWPAGVIRERGPRALAAAMADALRGAVPVPTAAACTAYARERFSWPAVAGRVKSVYAEALQ